MKQYVFIALVLLCGQVSANEAAWPSELDIPYSADHPPGPGFTDAQKREQRRAGVQMLTDLRAAQASGAGSFTIPPGNYRFGTAWQGADSFRLENFDRDGKTPFRILGHGATLWFDLGPDPAPKVNYMVRLIGCSNIVLEGLTIDSDPRGCMDARVTDVDVSGNRIQVEPLAGTQRLIEVPAKPAGANVYRVSGTQLLTGVPTQQARFIPFKSNGHHIAPLYNIDGGWGPDDLYYKGFSQTADGKYWFAMKTGVLLKTVRDPAWLATYGPEGVLEKGDVLTFLWSVSFSIQLQNCKQITVRDCHVYAAKSVMHETGYGGNQWINCRFMPRPRTNNLLGGEGRMSSECRVGSLVENCLHLRSSDDAIMYRALWRHATGVTAGSLTFHRDVPELLAPGDKAEVYHRKTKAHLGQLTVASVQGRRVVRFREPVGDAFAEATVLFTDHMNAGWAIRNSRFLDCYQTVPLIQCGPGVFENNRVERAGSFVRVHNGVLGHIEGGIPDSVTFRGNVFLDSFVCPASPGFFVNGDGHRVGDLSIEGNVICRTGREAIGVTFARNLTLRGNLIVQPFVGHLLKPEKQGPDLPAFRLVDVAGARITNNLLIRRDAVASVLGQRDSSGIEEQANTTVQDPDGRIEAQIRTLASRPEASATAIISHVRAMLAPQSKSQPGNRPSSETP